MKKFASVLLIVLVLTAFVVMPVMAQGQEPPAPPSVLDVILSVFVMFGELAGVAALIAALVNVLKTVKVVTDATAGKWFAGFNLIALALLVYIKLFQPQIAIDYLNTQAAVLAQILLLVLGYLVQLGAGQFAHGVFAKLRLPWIGKSFSRDRETISG